MYPIRVRDGQDQVVDLHGQRLAAAALVVVLTACSVDNYVTNNFLCTPLQLDVYS
jgi:uncharacterized protein YcgI (DUF1989 family)